MTLDKKIRRTVAKQLAEGTKGLSYEKNGKKKRMTIPVLAQITGIPESTIRRLLRAEFNPLAWYIVALKKVGINIYIFG